MKEFVASLTKEKQPRMNGKITPTFATFTHCIQKSSTFFFHTLLANFFKQRYISSVTSYNY